MAELTPSQLVYKGCFRTPSGAFGCTLVNHALGSGAGQYIAFDPAGNGGAGSLFVTSHLTEKNAGGITGRFSFGKVLEISLATPVIAETLAGLNTCTVLQNAVDPFEGAGTDGGDSNLHTGGMMVDGSNLYLTSYEYYDGNGNQSLTHFRRPKNLSTTGQVLGPLRLENSVTPAQKAGYWSGYIAPVPADHQVAIGNNWLVGQCGIAITSRTSQGPSIYGVDLADFGVTDPVPLDPLLYYPSDHPLEPNGSPNPGYSVQSEYWNGTSRIHSAVLVSGFDSLLFFGKQGIGPWCYGTGTECADPCVLPKGTHAYPYRNQIWHYNINEILAATNPWDFQAYTASQPDLWPITIPFTTCTLYAYELGGVGYDITNQTLYVAGMHDDTTRLIIHVFEIDGTPPVGATLSATPSTVRAGQSATVTWADIGTPHVEDWIGLFSSSASDSQRAEWFYLDASKVIPGLAVGAAGNFSFPIPGKMRSGTYNCRLFSGSSGAKLATSAAFTVQGKKVRIR